jgi:PAS domain S-box-containing protein
MGSGVAEMEDKFWSEKEVSCRVTNSVLKYMESLGYNTGSVIDGLPYTYEYLIDPFNWVTHATRETICQRAAKSLSDEAIMFKVGLVSPKLSPLGGIEHLVRLLGSPKLVYKAIPKYASFFDKTFKFKVTLVNNNKATVSMSLPDGYALSKHSCYYAMGILAAIPTLWGLPPAYVHEKQCMCQPRGKPGPEPIKHRAKACIYEVTWQQMQPWHSKLLKNIFRQSPDIPTVIRELENNFRLLDKKNSELFQTNHQLAKVRELALAVDSVGTVAEVWPIVVDLAKEIPGVRFVLIHQSDSSGNNIITPYYSKIDKPSILKKLKAAGFDSDIHFGKSATSRTWTFPVAKSRLAQDIIANPRTIVLKRLSEVADGILSRPICHTIQKLLGFKKIVLLPVLPDSPNQSVIIFFTDDSVPINILEMVGAHCAFAIKNSSTLNILAERNEELKESEERFRIASQITSDIVYERDLQTGIATFYGDIDTHLGYDPGEYPRTWEGWRENVHPEDLAWIESMSIDQMGPGVPYSIEYRMRKKDGTYMTWLDSVMVICNEETGRPVKFIGAASDISERKQAEEALAGEAIRRRILVEQSRDGIVVLDESGKVFEANHRFSQMLGYSPEETLKLHVWDWDTQWEKEQLLEMIRTVDATGDHFETYHRRKDGTNIDVEISTNGAIIDGRKLVFCVCRDITERKKAEVQLKESEEYARTLSNSLGLGVFVVDAETREIVDVNPAAVKQTGLSKEQIIGKVCHNFVCLANKEICPVLDLGRTVDFSEHVLLTASDEPLPILKSAVPITRQGRKYLLESFVNIKMQKQMEAELSKQKELIERILLTTPNAVLVLDRDLKVILANRTFCETFRLDSSQVEGKHLGDILYIAELHDSISQVLAGKHSRQRVEFRHKVADKERILVAEILTMKEKEEVLAIISDVTEEREQLEKLYLADRLVSVGEMASGIAHELNNPLTGVIGFSGLLLESKLPQDVAGDIATINKEAKRAAAVIKNLLTFARKHTPRRQVCQVNSIIEDVVRLRAYEHGVNNIQVDVQLDPNLPEIITDYYQMQQVFLNIVLNAESAMIETNNGGTLTIATEKVSKSVRITFTDDGPGIPEPILKRIFDPFYTTKEVGKGTGLGLSICHGIVTSHNGTIYAENGQSKGATFVVELPTETY